jgi:hypothetical protein
VGALTISPQILLTIQALGLLAFAISDRAAEA